LKSRARANQSKEEIQLVEEEMRRALEFGRWSQNLWMQRATLRTGTTSQLQEGLMAYAAEMADMEDRRRILWEVKWADIRERARLVLEGQLKDRDGEEGILIPKMTVELDIDSEEGQDHFDGFSDSD
jgi:hypothetical protein